MKMKCKVHNAKTKVYPITNPIYFITGSYLQRQPFFVTNTSSYSPIHPPLTFPECLWLKNLPIKVHGIQKLPSLALAICGTDQVLKALSAFIHSWHFHPRTQ